jgi:hypothetical protein
VEKILALDLNLPDGTHVVVKLEERSLDLRGLPGVPERRGHRLFAPNEDLDMAAVWQCERADGIWIWNARWGLEACAHHL